VREHAVLQNGSLLMTPTGGRSEPQTTHRPSSRTLGSLSLRSAASLKRVLTQERYLPREVFFGRFGFAGVFSVWASDFGRFFPATSDSFP
jgi:hypothetical protein